MALEGTLRDFSLADIFQLIGLQRKTGVLTLSGKDDTVTVTFLDGKVVGADSGSHRLETRLGHVLMKSGMLTQDQLARALEIQKETLQRLGFILTHYQIISNDSLKQALQLQILQIVYRLFRWKDGEYHFSQETTIEYDRDNVVPISAESILMEGARMIDEWPIIEKRIRSTDQVFRRKGGGHDIVVVGGEDVDEVDFEPAGAPRKKKAGGGGEKIRIAEEEKQIYDLLDGKRTVGEILEMSRLSEFDTSKALYELLTRDIIEEVRGAGEAAAAQAAAPVDELAVAETPVPLPLVILLAGIAIGSIVTSFKNPLNSIGPIGTKVARASAPIEALKAISLERIQSLGEAIEKYNVVNGHLPVRLQDLAPYYISSSLLSDPWGNAYKYLQQPSRYLVIGFTPDGKADTDLFLSRGIDAGVASAPTKPARGGITLID
ncbi:MAG TPA: DUF4388 domain-containing protein [Thermoanaerobaculia bacterium]|nr:DUF4388 domain-containing protein [Thermoanaerobaculia bacterium]